jgi:23S rRNA (pseudouridine1915-N3)-methyltransferase
VRVLAIGKAPKTAPESALFARYAERLKPGLTLTEFNDGQGSAIEIKRREAAALLAAITAQDFVVALDSAGQMPDSLIFSSLLTKWLETGRRVTFIIGGAEGLDAAVMGRADANLSLGSLTWPHLLARAMLAEQIYRARMIATGHPYHRAGRP